MLNDKKIEMYILEFMVQSINERYLINSCVAFQEESF